MKHMKQSKRYRSLSISPDASAAIVVVVVEVVVLIELRIYTTAYAKETYYLFFVFCLSGWESSKIDKEIYDYYPFVDLSPFVWIFF